MSNLSAKMQNTVKIEHLKLSEKDKLLAFLQDAYADNPRMCDADFWTWHFLETPFANQEKLPVWVAKSGETIAGQIAAIPVKINVGGEQKEAIWILDLIVSKDFRRQGLAKKLVKAAEEFCPLILGVNTNEQHAPKLLQSLGFVIVGKIPRFHKLLFAGNDIRELANLKPLREVVNIAFAPIRRKFKPNKNVRIVEKIDESFDKFWAEAETQWSCVVRREAKFLEWQYLKQPQKKFEIIGYFEGEKMLGYAVLFFRKASENGAIKKAAITDICYLLEKSQETIEALLQESLRIAIERRVGGLVVDVIDELLEHRLEKLGFWRVKNPLQLMVKSPERQDLLYNPKQWFLTRGDSDISIFEDTNL